MVVKLEHNNLAPEKFNLLALFGIRCTFGKIGQREFCAADFRPSASSAGVLKVAIPMNDLQSKNIIASDEKISFLSTVHL